MQGHQFIERMGSKTESRLLCVSHENQGIHILRPKQEDFNKECLKRSLKYATPVMVFG